MKLVRLPLLALAALSLAACSSDLTTPEARTIKPVGPRYDSGVLYGSGAKAKSDSTTTTVTSTSTSTTGTTSGTTIK